MMTIQSMLKKILKGCTINQLRKWILSASDENNHQQEDTVIQRMDRDKDTYNFIKYWAKSINGNYLDELERELIIRKWLLNQKHECICRECYISRRTYFRKVKEAERILILLWKLDHYDEYGNMRQYQEIFQERYEALGERAKIDEYYPDIPLKKTFGAILPQERMMSNG